MVFLPVQCPHCHSDQVGKGGKTSTGKQRYRCQNEACPHRTFIRDYSYRGCLPELKRQAVDRRSMAVAFGIRRGYWRLERIRY